MPVGRTNFVGNLGIGNVGGGAGGDMAQIGRHWLGAMQQQRAPVASPQSQDAAYFAALQAARRPQQPVPMPAGPPPTAGLDGLAAGAMPPPVPMQQGAIPPMHPRGQVTPPVPIPASKPIPPLPPEQMAADPRDPRNMSPGKRFAAGFLQNIGQQLSQGQGY